MISINAKGLHQWQTRASYSQPLLHFSNNLIITPETFHTDDIFEDSKELEISGSNIWAVWLVGNNRPSDWCDFFLCFDICIWSCVAVLKKDCSNIFVKSNLPETRLQAFKSLNLQIWGNGLTTWHNVYKHLPFMYFHRKTVARAQRLCSLGPVSEPAFRKARRLTVLLSTALTW
jgi:hypothetical protein